MTVAEQLTPQQKQAVVHRGGKLLVSAAAGSGKTKVLVDRLLSYLNDPADPANLDEFLIITYTKAAASELRGKIAAKLTEQIALEPENRHLQRQMQRLFLTKISTVHGFCGDILREYAYRLDLPADFRVADENECREIREAVISDLLDRMYETAGEDADFRAFVDTQGLGRDDRFASEIVLKVYDSARCHLNPDKWLDKCLEDALVTDITDAGQTIWGAFLMEHLFSYLDSQICVMRRCCELARGMGKAETVLSDTCHQLERLRASTSWDEAVQRKNVDFGRLTFPKKGVDADTVERIKACRNACKAGLEKHLRAFADESALVLEDLEQSSAAAKGLIMLVRQFDREYTRAKQSRHVLDFGDLEHRTLDLLLGKGRGNPTSAAAEIGSRFREIMVDEYQDSNGVQDAIFEALTGKKQNCFMVGDVKQSIYQFRLADPGIFLEKYHTFSPVEDGEGPGGRKVLLSANFRSGGEIIEAVNDVFSVCMSETVGGLFYTDAEKLREGIAHNALPDPAVELYGLEVGANTYEEEAAFVAKRIRDMLNSGALVRDGEGFRPVQPEDIVILLRSPGSVGRYYQKALENLGIPCTSGGGTDLLKAEEICTLRSILQTVANPRQDIPLISALASPAFGFTANDLAFIRSCQKHGCFYDALTCDDSPKVRAFLETLDALRREARMNPVSQLIEKIFLLTRMDSIYAAMDDGEVRRENLRTFYGLAAEYESASRRDLNQFLAYLELMDENGLIIAGEHAGSAVTIMSIHKSKGLEFPVVFLGALSREFNRESLRAQVLCDRTLGLGLSVADPDNRIRYPAISKRAIVAKAAAESLSEELRVLYVAMTRARDRLIMTYSAKKLADELSELVNRMELDDGVLLSRDVVCPGEWILMCALGRMEAGEFHNLAGRPAKLRLSGHPWKIQVAQPPVSDAAVIAEQICTTAVDEDAQLRLQRMLGFSYPYPEATGAPSKQTATQQKGRTKDQEAAEETPAQRTVSRAWRKPSFKENRRQAVEYGNTVHLALRYLDYAACSSADGVRKELERLASGGTLTREQLQMLDCNALTAFFASELGTKLRMGADHIREFKFSILDDGSNYDEALKGEQILLQGVVDCAILEDDGITVIDFKTDRVPEESLDLLVQRYESQVRTYARALERVYQKPVKASYLYFFKWNRFVPVT